MKTFVAGLLASSSILTSILFGAGGASFTPSRTAAPNQTISNAAPVFKFHETDAAADEKKWWLSATAGVLQFAAYNDAEGAAFTWLSADRTGVASIAVTSNATSWSWPTAAVTVGGSLVVGNMAPTAVDGIIPGSGFNNAGSIGANVCAAAVNVTMTGAAVGDAVHCAGDANFDKVNCSSDEHITSTNTGVVYYCNETATPRDCDGAGSTWRCVTFSW